MKTRFEFNKEVFLGNGTLHECYFIPKKGTTSATICANCGLEKVLHTIGEGTKVINPDDKPGQLFTRTQKHKMKIIIAGGATI